MKYKKILFVTSRYPFPVTGGDKLRISEVMKFLSKKNKLDLISIGNENKKINFIKNQYVYKNNLFNKIINIFKSFFRNEPMQVGLYKIPAMKEKIGRICKNYDVIVFHLIRSAYYVPNNFKGIKILEMTDLISKNYNTVEKNLSFINPFRYLYKFEKNKLKLYEYNESKKFDKIVLVNKQDINNSIIKKNKRIVIIGNGTHLKQNIFAKYKKKNNIIFFGNINSLANSSACIEFVNNYLPTLKKRHPNLEFKIYGNCSKILKIYFKFKGVKVKSNISDLKFYCKNSLAGICNVKIQSGLQNKILDYTSIGLPIIINEISNNFKSLKGKNVLVFHNKSEFFFYINKLLKNENFRNKISKINFDKTKKYFNWNKILTNYSKIIK